MKRTISLIALVAICSAMMVSCKSKQSEPTPEEVQAQKVALADSVLAKIDAFAEQFINVSDDADIFAKINLTEEEKMVKPDYLLDPNDVSKFVTKRQKVNALAIYECETFIRNMYGMPTDEVKEVTAKLALELNHPADIDMYLEWDKPSSELIKSEYNACKERGDVSYFWQFENAILYETNYLFANNPELYLKQIGEENFTAYSEEWNNLLRAIWTLAPYDEEINMISKSLPIQSEADINGLDKFFQNITTAIETYNNYSSRYIDERNSLLQ